MAKDHLLQPLITEYYFATKIQNSAKVFLVSKAILNCDHLTGHTIL